LVERKARRNVTEGYWMYGSFTIDKSKKTNCTKPH
jgi:hypothetical protein